MDGIGTGQLFYNLEWFCRKIWQFSSIFRFLDKDLKFKREIGKVFLCFLDLKISTVGYKLVTTVYSKQADNLLCWQSNSYDNPKVI